MRSDARRAALTALIDHAPLFPPASLPVPAALEEDRRARADEHAWLLARLVWPSSRLDELEGEDRALSVLLDGAYSGDLRAEAVETRWAAGLDGLSGEAYVELPLGDGLEEKVAALAGRGLRAKVRCGGAEVPTRRERSAASSPSAATPACPFKATAGLHHPLAAEGRHGFLNVLAACAFEDEAALTGDVALDRGRAPLARPRGRLRGARARAPRPARRGRQLLLLRAGRGAAGAGDPVIQGFGTFTPRRRAAPRVPLGTTRSSDLGPGSLDELLPQGRDAWERATESGRSQRGGPSPLADVELRRPLEVADYVDFYSSLEHATNMGRMFRPEGDPRLPNWRHLPGRLPRPRRDGRRERHAGPEAARPGKAPGRRCSGLRPVKAARHRARARLPRRGPRGLGEAVPTGSV